MSLERTFSIIKPDAVAAGHAGEILAAIEQAGFKILALRMTRLTEKQAQGFYAVHREKPFFAGLVKFMTEGPIVVMALEREDAIQQAPRSDGRDQSGQRRRRHHPQALRHEHRAQLRARFGRAGDRRDRAGLLLRGGGIAVDWERLRVVFSSPPLSRYTKNVELNVAGRQPLGDRR